MDIAPLAGHPALVMDGDRKGIAVADLHIGMEKELHDIGISIPSQTPLLIERMHGILDSASPDYIVIIGDLKNSVDRISKQEYREIPRFIEALLDRDMEIHFFPGNHDGLLDRLIPRRKKGDRSPEDRVHLGGPRGGSIEGVGFFHGHTWPDSEVISQGTIVAGHNHPNISFRDALGTRMSEPCWLRARFQPEMLGMKYPDIDMDVEREMILMPSFTPYGSGTAINEERSFLGPLFKGNYLDMENADIYLLDGAFLGNLKDLRPLAKNIG